MLPIHDLGKVAFVILSAYREELKTKPVFFHNGELKIKRPKSVVSISHSRISLVGNLIENICDRFSNYRKCMEKKIKCNILKKLINS